MKFGQSVVVFAGGIVGIHGIKMLPTNGSGAKFSDVDSPAGTHSDAESTISDIGQHHVAFEPNLDLSLK